MEDYSYKYIHSLAQFLKIEKSGINRHENQPRQELWLYVNTLQ